MWWVTLLNGWLLLVLLAVPWIAFIACLTPFRKILKREWWVLVLIGVGITAFFVSNLNLRHEVLFQAITNMVHEPWLTSFRESILSHGRPPLWMSEFGVGLPGMGNPYFTAMSPMVSVLLLLPESIPPFGVLLLLHFLVAAAGAYLLARSIGVSIPGAVLAATVAVFNLWVFRRLQAEIYAAYVLAYAWFPLSWALLLHWLRTNKLLHAAYVAVPLTFIGLTMPTMAVFLSVGVNVMVAIRAAGLLWRRKWKHVGTLVVGMIMLGVTAGLLGAPELLATREQEKLAAGSNRISAPISAGPGSPNQGWRTHDFSAVDFGHLLLGDFGARFLPDSSNKLSGFGVPYAPHNEVVLLSMIGMVAALLVRSWRKRTFAVSHLVLGLVLANIFVSGFVYVLAWYGYPLFTRTGIFPGVGAMLLLLITTFAGVGVDAILRLIVVGLRWMSRLHSGLAHALFHRFTVWATWALAFTGVAAWAISQVVNPVAVWNSIQGNVDEEEPLFPDYQIATMPREHRDRFPHLALLKEELPEGGHAARLFCMSDTSQWPSPCLEDGALAAGFELVGIGEQSWTPPGYFAATQEEAVSAWNESGEYSPLLNNFLRLASVEGIVTTRQLPLPLLAKIPWDDPPKSEGYGYVSGFLQKEREVEWSPGYLIELFVHTLPNPLPRAAFVEPVRVKEGSEAEAATLELFRKPNLDVSRAAVVYTAEKSEDNLPISELQERFLAASDSAEEAKLSFSSPAPGQWHVQGEMPKPGVLLFSQLFYPGFRAWVNGKPVPAERANLFLTAVAVPAGKVSVELTYVPLSTLPTSVLSAAVAGGILFATVRGLRRPRVT